MKYISRKIVVGLILLSSFSAFAQPGSAEQTPVASAPIEIQLNPSDANKSPEGGGGYRPERVESATEAWFTVLKSCPAASNGVAATVGNIKRDVKKYKENQGTCDSREDTANKFCMESRNPEIKKYIMIAQVLTGALSGMADACSKFGQVMDAGNKMLTAYQIACSSWRGVCMSACGSAVSALKSIKKQKTELVKNAVTLANSVVPTDPTFSSCKQLASTYAKSVEDNMTPINDELKIEDGEEAYRAVAKKEETCKNYAKELATAGVGMLSMVKSFGTANNCEKQTTNVASQTPVDCTIPENKQNNMTCICQDAPRTPGCNTGLDTPTVAKGADSLRAASSSDYTPENTTATKLDGIDNSGEMELASKNGESGSSLPGAPSGGSGAGLDGGGGMGGGAGGAEAKKASGLNTNILGGEGGGGGGGSWGGYGGGGDPSLRQYLPGGAKDPTIGMAGAALSKEVTSQGGKSNWEKVKERYRDNKPSLLGY